MANWLISRMTGVRQRDFGCTLRAYRSWVVRELKLYGSKDERLKRLWDKS